MKPQSLTIIVIIALLCVVVFTVFLFWQEYKTNTVLAPVVTDYKNLTYRIENQDIKLVNGYSEMETAPGSASKVITKYFGNEAFGDLNSYPYPYIRARTAAKASVTRKFRIPCMRYHVSPAKNAFPYSMSYFIFITRTDTKNRKRIAILPNTGMKEVVNRSTKVMINTARKAVL